MHCFQIEPNYQCHKFFVKAAKVFIIYTLCRSQSTEQFIFHILFICIRMFTTDKFVIIQHRVLTMLISLISLVRVPTLTYTGENNIRSFAFLKLGITYNVRHMFIITFGYVLCFEISFSEYISVNHKVIQPIEENMFYANDIL